MSNLTASQTVLDCESISKRFGAALALDGVDFSLRSGEVHGLVGTNGAGKSTLMKILAGAFPHYEGKIRLDGQPIALTSPQAARQHGIAMVYQELSAVGQLSLAENLFLGRQPTTRLGRIDWRAMREKSRDYLQELGIAVEVDRRLDSYPLAVRQMVEIARGLHSGARILILDEPTSALSPPEARRLFELVDRLRARGVTIVLVSHHLDEVLAACDRVTILRDGRHVRTAAAKSLDKHQVIQLMLGERGGSHDALEAGFESSIKLAPRSQATPRLVAEHLSLAGKFADISLSVAPGECLGLYGYAGAGHQELVHTLAGALRSTSGRVLVDGATLPRGSTRAAVRQGVVLVAADRAKTLVHRAPIYQNITMAHLRTAAGEWLTRGRETRIAQPLLAQVGCRPPAPLRLAGNLSGGNQQKVVFAKWLLGPVRVLLLDEPTRGMDVAAKQEVMQLVRRQQDEGAAVVLASTEPELILAYADRIQVIGRGSLRHEFEGTQVDEAALLKYA